MWCSNSNEKERINPTIPQTPAELKEQMPGHCFDIRERIASRISCCPVFSTEWNEGPINPVPNFQKIRAPSKNLKKFFNNFAFHATLLCYPSPMSRYKFPETIGPKFCKPILPWVELFWHSKKRYPTDGELVEQFGLTLFQLERLHASKYYENCLKARGISREQSNLTEIQVAAISLITNFSDTRPPDVKMASIGVTPEELNGWYSNSIFQRELAARADSVLDNIFPEAQAQLARQIKKGSFPALKFYYEITGRSQAPEVVNLKLAMQRLVEAVQKHVKDPEVIAAIGREMQGLTQASSAAEVIEQPTQPPVAELTFKQRYEEHIKNG